MQEAVNGILLQKHFSQEETFSEEPCDVTLAPAQGGLSVPNLKAQVPLNTPLPIYLRRVNQIPKEPGEQSIDYLRRIQQTIKKN